MLSAAGGEVLVLPGRGRRDLKRLLQERALPPWERERLIVVMAGERCLGVLQPPAYVLWQAEGRRFIARVRGRIQVERKPGVGHERLFLL